MRFFVMLLSFIAASASLLAQSVGVAGTVGGSVVDPTGAVIGSANVTLENDFAHYKEVKAADDAGKFLFTNVPPASYHLLVSAAGFELSHTDIVVRSNVPLDLKITLLLARHTEAVEVHEADTLDVTAVSHSSVGEGVFAKLPTSTVASGLSDIITLTTPGVVADSNGFFHPLGDHAQMSFSVDNQPITDQQGYIFSTQLPPNAIQSLDAIFGAPPAEYGDKTSLVITAITRSGLGQSEPHGDFLTQYGSFGTVGQNASLGFGNNRVGNFTAVNWIRSGRFLDTPEFRPFHAIGNNENIFNRLDFQASQVDALHLNVFFARSWFQIPNTYVQQDSGQDQRQQVRSINIAPGWVHTLSSSALLTINPYYRRDLVGYYPSTSYLSDQPVTLQQNRSLANFGVKADISYFKGRHNAKAGIQISRTNLHENFQLGVTDPTFNPVCITADGSPIADPAIIDPNSCAALGYQVNPNLSPGLIPYDLTRGGGLFHFDQGAAINEQAFFVQDAITLGQHFTVNGGLRFDRYDGISYATAWEPRAGIAYQPWQGTVLRVSYSRSLETPLNENLVLSSATGAGGLATNVFGAAAAAPLRPGGRNQFNAGFQQGFGSKFVLDGDYFWKYTDNAYDLDTLLTTAIVFPIEWRKSKMDGFALKLTMAETKGFSFFTTLGHTRARIFGPEVGGIIFNQSDLTSVTVQRVDHDQALQSTTYFQYQLPKHLGWVAFTWRFDSGIVSNAVPDLASLLSLTPDEQQMIGFYCGSQVATIANPITYCTSNYGAKLVNIPAPGTENDDKNPARVKPRNLLDLGIGSDDLFHTDRVKWTGRFTVLNLTDKVALYNFLSTCAGTHFVAPRTFRGEFGVRF